MSPLLKGATKRFRALCERVQFFLEEALSCEREGAMLGHDIVKASREERLYVRDDGTLSPALIKINHRIPDRIGRRSINKDDDEYPFALIVCISEWLEVAPDEQDLLELAAQQSINTLIEDEPIARAIMQVGCARDDLWSVWDHAERYFRSKGFGKIDVEPWARKRLREIGVHPHIAQSLEESIAIGIAAAHDFGKPYADPEGKAMSYMPEGYEVPEGGQIGPKRARVVVWYDGLEIEEGVFYVGMPNDVYHAQDCLSNSGIKRFVQSPAHYRYPEERERSRYMELGDAIHVAVLEPELFARDYCVVEGAESRNQAEYNEKARVYGRERTFTRREGAMITGMQRALYVTPAAEQLLGADGWTELSGFVRLPVEGVEGGVLVRVRFDKIVRRRDGSYVALDVKKTQDAREDAFARSAQRYGYDTQAALYSWAFRELTGERLQAFVFCAVEEKSPHGVGVWVLSDDWHSGALPLIEDVLRRYAECKERGVWPCYNVEPKILEKPRWMGVYEGDDEEE